MIRHLRCPGRPDKLLVHVAAILAPSVFVAGCLDRPIGLVEPSLTSTVTEVITQSAVSKIDLLLAIDNSASMADKQAILAQAVPDLVESLVNPACVDNDGKPVANQPHGPQEVCPSGSSRTFEPVLDIHIGIVSSSLGGHGGSQCADTIAESQCGGAITTSKNDHGHLLSRADACDDTELVPTYAGKGFLAWDPDKQLDPPGESEIGSLDGSAPGLIPTLADMVAGVGQIGCGYESQLESVYRFLVDPEPYAKIDASSGKIQTSGIDEALLAARKDFLRPDSLVAVLMLSDENDCSIKESGYFFRAADGKPLPRPRAVCATDPNDACCSSCGLPTPKGCAKDPTCFDDKGNVLNLPLAEDPVDLRCFDQKRRFGIDFLYPADRYVQAFSSPTITTRSGEIVANPLLPKSTGANAARSADLVFIAGIVGVPWQDIARDHEDLKKGLKSAAEMRKDGTWDLLLADPETGSAAEDPLMRESVWPRAGIQPVTGEALDLTPDSPNENSINGHEWNTKGEDLQYACIFDLPTATDCPNDASCSECRETGEDNPLCDENTPTNRVRAKAYPGVRQLEVLRGLGNQGIVGSVCPKQVADRSSADYGYRPAIGAIIGQLATKLGGQCLPRTLNDVGNGQVNCLVLEAKNSGGSCSCDSAHARIPVDPKHQAIVDAAAARSPEAGWDCFCEIPQLEKEELAACQDDPDPAPQDASGMPISGFCYVDATTEPAIGNPALVARCAANEKRMVRLVGDGEPSLGATVFITCSVE